MQGGEGLPGRYFNSYYTRPPAFAGAEQMEVEDDDDKM